MNRVVLWRVSASLLLIALTLTGILLGIIWRRGHFGHPARGLTVTYFDVGAGDCALVRSPEGQTILIDTGGAETGEALAAAIKARGVSRVDLLILTSPDPGSLGGVPTLLDSGIGISRIWDNAVPEAGDARRAALEAIRRHRPRIPSQTASGGDVIQIGERMSVSTVWPPDTGAAARRDPLICRVNYGSTAFVFEGTASAVAETALISQAAPRIECTGACTDLVLQTAAGAAGPPSPEMLRRATPTVAVLTGRTDGGPPPTLLRRLRAAGAALWQTGTQGTITVTTDGRGTLGVRAEPAGK